MMAEVLSCRYRNKFYTSRRERKLLHFIIREHEYFQMEKAIQFIKILNNRKNKKLDRKLILRTLRSKLYMFNKNQNAGKVIVSN